MPVSGECAVQAELGLLKELRKAREKVHAALEDSIDLPKAIDALLDLISSTNIYLMAPELQLKRTPKGERIWPHALR